MFLNGLKIINKNNGKVLRTFEPSKQYEKDGKFNVIKFKMLSRWQFAGCDIVKLPKAPTAYDVLACLQKYDVGTFEDFCSEFGYDEDSRKAFKIYKAVIREWKNVELLFTEEQIEKLQEIQ